MFLMHTVAKIKNLYLPTLNISIAHFNHNKRSKMDAMKDYQLIQYWSNKYDLKLYYRELDVRKISQSMYACIV